MSLSALTSSYVAFSFGFATVLVQLTLFCFVIKRKLRADFGVFAGYVAVSAVSYPFLAALSWRVGTAADQYFYSYWVINTLAMLLQFGVMSEALTNALKPFAGLIDLGKMLFRWAALFLLLVAVITAFATSGSLAAKCLAAVNIIERSLRLMQCGLLLLFFLFERRLALSWRSYSVSLALGLGITAALDLSLSYVGTYLTAWTPVFDLTDAMAAFGIAGFWLACFARPEPAKKNVMDSPSKVIFQRWNEALLSAAAHDKNPAFAAVDSFLPGIEKTVDRVLARKIAH